MASMRAPEEYIAVDAPWPVLLRRSQRRRTSSAAQFEQGELIITVPAGISRADEIKVIETLIQKVQRKQARTGQRAGDAELAARSELLISRYLQPHVGQFPRPSSVRWVSTMDKRWGSCTAATGEIRLSDRLLAMPQYVRDGVLCHELAHLLHPNHGPEFWELVQQYPEHERASGYLQGWSHARQLPENY